MLDCGNRESLPVERLRGGRERRVLSFEPAKQNAPLWGVRRDHGDASRRRKERDGRRVDDLKSVKANGVQKKRRKTKPATVAFSAALIPGEDKSPIVSKTASL